MLNKAFSTFPMLTTERLTLRQLSESDVQEIFLLRSDKTINKFLNRKPSETLDDALSFIKNIRSNELLYWAVTQTKSEKLVGTICLFDLSDELSKCEIGYELLADHQGKGIMSEALQKVVGFAVDTVGVKTIEAFTHKENHSSTKLLEKLNFKRINIVEETNPNLLLFRLSN
ncbi:MAG: GNAT family N-acetyltransferase [Ferruginibacter sp.]|nr:GNAT family N-acetyltransferase [Ferruginibacter sp.]